MLPAFSILGITILLFVHGKLRPDVVAMLSLLALYLCGLLNTDQALAGFSDPTVIMIAALFIVGGGLSRTGVTDWLGNQMMKQAGTSPMRILILVMAFTGIFSGFLSNTGIVAMLIPMIIMVAYQVRVSASKFLIPLAFAANVGGLLTMIGTPPNIIVNSILSDAGYKTFSFFEFSLIGLPLLLVLIVYMVFVGRKMLPDRDLSATEVESGLSLRELVHNYALDGHLFRARIRRGSRLIGQTLAELGADQRGVPVLHIERRGPDYEPMILDTPKEVFHTPLQYNDVLLVKSNLTGDLASISKRYKLGIQPFADDEQESLSEAYLSREVGIAEILITPRSDYKGRPIREGSLGKKFNVQLLGVSRQGKILDNELIHLKVGDTLLVRGTWEDIALFKRETRNFVVIGSPSALKKEIPGLSAKAIMAILILIGMIVMMLFKWVPSSMAAVIAAMAMVLTGCLKVADAYRWVGWQSVVLIAAMIPMSTALSLTGGAEYIANGLVQFLGEMDPRIFLGGVFLLTATLSQVINNTATTVLVAPIVMTAAIELGLSPIPLLMATAVSASTAFLTPIGTTTNVMVIGPGGYTFNDYFKTGLPLLLLFLVISIILIPLIWPF